MLIGNAVGQLKQESLLPDGTVGETSLVEVGVSVQLSLGTECVPSLETVFAVTTGIVHVAPTDSVSDLEDLGVGTELLYDTDTFVSESHVGVGIVQV
jgi:hypothetical protein